MFDSVEQRDACSQVRLSCLLSANFLSTVDISVPEFEIKLGRGAERGSDEVATFRRPEYPVAVLAVERFCTCPLGTVTPMLQSDDETNLAV